MVQTEQVQPAIRQSVRSWLTLRYGSLPLFGVLLLAVTVFHLAFLMRVPLPYVDEAWNASRSLGLIQTGHAYGSLDAGVFEHYDGYWTIFPWLATVVHVPAILLLGPTLLAMRLTSLVFGLGLLVLIYVIGSRLYTGAVGLLSAFLLSLSYPFLISSHLGRHDIVIAVMGYGAIALYLTDSAPLTSFSVRSLLSGLVVGLTLDVHLNGVVFGPVFLALFLLDYGWRSVLRRRFWSFVVGAAAGIAFFVLLQVVPFPQTYQALGKLSGNYRVPPILTLDPVLWMNSFVSSFILLGILPTVLVLMSLLAMVRNRLNSDNRVLTVFGALLVTFSLILQNKAIYYTILLAPAAWLLIGVGVSRFLEQGWRSSSLAYARTVLLGALVVCSIIFGLSSIVTNPQEDFAPILDRIHRSVSGAASIIGAQTYWFSVPGQRYLSWEQLVYYRRYAPGSSLEDAFGSLHPDYIIADRRMESWLIEDNIVPQKESEGPYLPRDAMESFLAGHTHLVDSFDTQSFGTVRIYKVDSY